MQKASTTDAKDGAPEGKDADGDSIHVAAFTHLLLITWLLTAVDFRVVVVHTTCSHKRAVFRL